MQIEKKIKIVFGLSLVMFSKFFYLKRLEERTKKKKIMSRENAKEIPIHRLHAQNCTKFIMHFLFIHKLHEKPKSNSIFSL